MKANAPRYGVLNEGQVELFESLDIGVIIVGADMEVLLANAWVRDVTKSSEEGLVGLSLLKLYPEIEDSRLASVIRQCLDTGMAGFLSHSLNPRLFPLLKSAGAWDEGNPIKQLVKVSSISLGPDQRGALIQIQDMTQAHIREELLRNLAKQLEERVEKSDQALSSAEDRLEDAIASLTQGFVVYSKDGKLLLHNAQYKEIFGRFGIDIRPGIEWQEVLQGMADTGMREDAKSDPEAWLRERTNSSRKVQAHNEILLSDGTWYQVNENETREGDRVAMLTDITELKERERVLRQAQKMEAVGQLTGGVAHDFNNMLTVILGNLEIALDSENNDDKTNRLMNTAQQAAMRGAELIEKLLSFSRQTAQSQDQVNLVDLVRSVESLMRRTLGEHISIEIEAAEKLPEIVVDESQFSSALLNLGINARDAMPNGGVITIAARLADQHPPNSIDATDGQVFVCLDVADTGSGMPDHIKQRVLEPFFTTKEQGKGTGLGLAMVNRFVQESGGWMEVHSEVDKGTNVRLFFPCAADFVANSDPVPVHPSGDQNPEKGRKMVLVVEDEEDVRVLSSEMLEGLGYDVIEASSGEEGMDLLARRAQDIDLVFTDIMMPGSIDGIQLASHVASEHPDIAVLLTSGFVGEGRLESEPASDRWPILWKPYRRSELQKSVAEIFSVPK